MTEGKKGTHQVEAISIFRANDANSVRTQTHMRASLMKTKVQSYEIHVHTYYRALQRARETCGKTDDRRMHEIIINISQNGDSKASPCDYVPRSRERRGTDVLALEFQMAPAISIALFVKYT